MRNLKLRTIAVAVLCFASLVCFGATKPDIGFNDNQSATPDFKFSKIPKPSATDAASKAQFYIVTGQADDQSGDIFKLHDGKLPASADDAQNNFFLKAGTEGGRLVVDLGSIIDVKQINTYSWHSGGQSAQVYLVYGSDGKANNFSTQPTGQAAPEASGWKRITKVDTRSSNGNAPGQYGVSISDTKGVIGKYRYLMFDISPADGGNTYYSEIDVIDANAPSTASSDTSPAGPPATALAAAPEPHPTASPQPNLLPSMPVGKITSGWSDLLIMNHEKRSWTKGLCLVPTGAKGA
jgi:hypothetical protein